MRVNLLVRTVLYSTVLYCTVLYCTVLYSTCWCGHSAWGSTWWPRAGPGSRTRPGRGSGQLPPHSGTSSPSPSPCSAPRAAGGPAGTSPSAGQGRASCTYLSIYFFQSIFSIPKCYIIIQFWNRETNNLDLIEKLFETIKKNIF